ncbi:glutathione S-transferase [Gluconacetobacter tumulicola]|uniref:Glutathione S-transferase n=1 Tax=Gluconacetobacter tumulicola TaxID=1017177 RepID=A0A7W4JFU6_9PROT|nr:glutathione S-transferase [Gluconacetobacter tumulicola]MBB2180502.1 glutathione S-transferase [Gluconacetobacter tumulicola]
MALEIILGNRNYSSWSMRAWMLLRLAGVPFDETIQSLYITGARACVIERGGETGLVPVLRVDGFPIWDTLAIVEYLYEQCPALWPADRFLRARARSYAGEVHSGLNALREAMPVNARGRNRRAVRTQAVEDDIARVAAIWKTAGSHPEGPWLFGRFNAADIMFAPVASRFQTYGVSLQGGAATYLERMLAHPLVREWFASGQDEAEIIDMFELPDQSDGKPESSRMTGHPEHPVSHDKG